MRRLSLLLALATILTASACGNSTSAGAPGPAGTGSVQIASPADWPAASVSGAPGSIAAPSPSPIPDDTVWLCKPGTAANPCEGDLTATSIDGKGVAKVQPAGPATDPPIDCFYVYPTVSRQKTINANLTIDAEETGVAVAQAARFSQVCHVYAPMYPQLTLAAIADPSKIGYSSAITAYASVATAFHSYLAHYNHGRGIVFIGHSQGAMMLTALLKYEVDPDSALRHQMVSALLMGGNIAVPVGKSVGGDFANIPACASSGQTGCVVAYSTFGATPPANAAFGRIASSINIFNRNSSAALQILCVNPAAPGGGTANLQPYIPTAGIAALLGTSATVPAASTPFVTYPNLYSAHCVNSGGAQWLQIDRIGGASDKRPAAKAGALSWGLHTVDVNIALGNLVELVRSESASFH
ncbi:MAG TPA: DUF3089 domain-containing protein [Candidatus Limnocylindrales bacterium]